MTSFPVAGTQPFALLHVAGYFNLFSSPSLVEVYSYREPSQAGSYTLARRLAVKAVGDFVEVSATSGGIAVTVNGVARSVFPATTPGGAKLSGNTGARCSILVVLPNGVTITVTRRTAATSKPEYLDFSLVVPDNRIAGATGACATRGTQPVSSAAYQNFPSDVRVVASALDRAPAGSPVHYRVDVANASSYAVNSVAFSAVPSWGSNVSWTCTELAGATCPAANGAGAPPTGLYLNAGATLRFDMAVLAPSPIAPGTVNVSANAPAWMTAATSAVPSGRVLRDRSGLRRP